MVNPRKGKIKYTLWLSKEEVAVVEILKEQLFSETETKAIMTDWMFQAIKRGDLNK